MTNTAQAQFTIKGKIVEAEGEPIPGATIQLVEQAIGTVSDPAGNFTLRVNREGEHVVVVRAVGYHSITQQVHTGQELTIRLTPDVLHLESVVVTGTRTERDRSTAPVVVNVSDQRIFNAAQAVSLSEGLRFQPGLRVENNCQNCGFTQLRMNGLGGPYTQILVDSRPIFSALNGVYGLEQIPVAMVERIEVVRGGGSALYGANAIAGTVNIITREPVEDYIEAGLNSGLIAGKVFEHTLHANGASISKDGNKGLSLFGSARTRNPLDLNGDGFSELTLQRNIAIGGKAFWKTNNRSKYTAEVHHIRERRRGGNLFDRAPHETDIAEQIIQNVYGGQVAYEGYSADFRTRYAVYASGQTTLRDSYYGGGGNSPDPEERAQALLYYGNTADLTMVGGIQLTHNFGASDKGVTVTAGLETQHNKVNDRMPGYERQIVQRVNGAASYAQAEWKPFAKLTLLTGARFDIIDLKGNYDFGTGETAANDRVFAVFNPRMSILWQTGQFSRVRIGYARGFRPPQAFDEDLHIKTLGGTAQFIRINKQLRSETSDSFTASFDLTRSNPVRPFSLLAETFFTRLNNPFVLEFSGETTPGGAFISEKRNGTAAYTAGLNLEAMYAIGSRWQFQAGATLQQARYTQPEAVLGNEQTGEEIVTDQLLRTPNMYGYGLITAKIFKTHQLNFTSVFTGPMTVANERTLQLVRTPAFTELNLKWTKQVKLARHSNLELSAGVQNLLNSFQRDLEVGAERDAGYIYGPIRPRTWFAALKFHY
ncbi:MAG: TonB-dependent receptor [Cytophagales bacterium]|nr:TonB-dependent receptor [Cytophagales bacterium]